ncbi:unnamed protein product [Schistosoma mattheei]|uniref:Transposase n=2 Tax=Schistosoma TaxID=6181 RepID=A0A183L4Q2_9TREM|nr:unnamed protein product [Schistosoma curassoni]VDP84332.1 unnamed protein product [Schistosoma mattheei]
MVTSGKIKLVWIEKLKPEQGENTLHGKRSPINKVTIEQVRIIFARKPVNFEYVHKIVELTVYIPTNSKLRLFWDFNVYQTW